MASLITLPNETLVQVLSGLSTADLVQTSRLSHRFRVLSQPILYREPCLTALRSSPDHQSIELFLRTLVGSPCENLCTHVRSLRVDWDDILTPDVVTHPDIERPVGFHGTHVVLLLHLLPSLRVLQITPPPDHPPNLSYFTHCIEQLHDTPRPGTGIPTFRLELLREFTSTYQPDCGGVSVKTVLALMRLPYIDSIDVHIVDNSASYSRSPIDDTPSISPVKKLRLSINDPADDTFLILLRAPIALTRLSFRPIGYYNSSIVGCIEALASQQSLEYLHLDLMFTYFANTEMVLPRWALRLAALQTLVCSFMELLGNWISSESPGLADLLPRTIRELYILEGQYWSYVNIAEKLTVLLDRKAEVLPDLEKIAIQRMSGYSEAVHGKLNGACEAAGVRLVTADSFYW